MWFLLWAQSLIHVPALSLLWCIRNSIMAELSDITKQCHSSNSSSMTHIPAIIHSHYIATLLDTTAQSHTNCMYSVQWSMISQQNLSAILALCEGKSTGFPLQRASNAKIWYFTCYYITSCWTNSLVDSDLRPLNAHACAFTVHSPPSTHHNASRLFHSLLAQP